MEFKRFSSCLFLIFMLSFPSSSQAYKFYVGGKDGWVVKPSEDYNHWAERNRFQVNDTLYFKYNKRSSSVLLVNKDDYYSCNTKKPTQSLSDGDSIFHFDHSGPYFFISGNADSCKQGQKIIIVVMAVRHHHHHAPPPSEPSTPASQPPASTPTLPPPLESPQSVSPSTSAEPPKSAEIPVDTDAPARAPSESGSKGLASSVGSFTGLSIVVSVVLGSFLGMV